MVSKRGRQQSADATKKRRKVIDLDTKIKLISQYERGKPVSVLSRELGLSHSTVSTILKDKTRITEAAKRYSPMKLTIVTKQRKRPLLEMERLLSTWIEEQTQKCIPLSMLSIQAKARSLFAVLKEREGPDCALEFNASAGWFWRFKQRFSLSSVKMTSDSASVGVEAAEVLVEGLDKIVKEEGCEPEAIFKVKDEEIEKEPEEVQKKFSLNGFAAAFSSVNDALRRFEEMDPNRDRFAKVERAVRHAVARYRQMYEEKQTVESKTHVFLSKTSLSSSDEPQPSA